MNTKVSFDCVAEWWLRLTDSEKSAFVEDPSRISAYLNLRAKEIAKNVFVTHLSDEQAIRIIVQQKGYALVQAEIIVRSWVRSWRNYASNMDYHGPVAWKVRQGFTLKIHAPLVGHCYEDLKYLQAWAFTDTPTADSLVFWVPRLAEQSTSKNVTQMAEYRAEQRQAHNLPSTHCDRFGSIALLLALILAHFKRTGERVPPRYFYAVSDTLIADDGRRLLAGGFGLGGLLCHRWYDSIGIDRIGFFLLGVEELGQPARQAGE